MTQTRQIAYKVWIKDLVDGEYCKEEGEWDPNYVLIKDKKVSRVNVIASVINTFFNEDGNSGNLEIDDGSGTIQIRAWNEDVEILKRADVGDLILLIGRVRDYNNNRYLTAEILKVLSDPMWARIRRIELENEYGKKELKIREVNMNKPLGRIESGIEMKRHKILEIIGKEKEINYDRVISESGFDIEEAGKIINELLKEGEIYQSRAGYLKII